MSSNRRDDAPRWGERDKHTVLHHDITRLSAPDKVQGKALYSQDRRVEGMLYGKLVSSPVAAGEIKVDLAPALDMEGVEAAIVIREGTISYIGQPVAAVAARTPELAEDAARAVRLEVEEAPWAVTVEQSIAPGAPQVTRRENRSARGSRQSGGKYGDEIETLAAIEEAEFSVEVEYSVPVQHHACLETHGVLCDYDGGEAATVYASTQVAFGVPGSAARELDLKSKDVRCIVEHMGGGFGSKFSMDPAGKAACALAKEVGRPVFLFNDRQQEFQTAGNRSGSLQKIKMGVAADGAIVGMHTVMEKLGGLGGGAGTRQPYVYEAGASYTEDWSIFTNTDGSRAMRAPGHPQVSFAMESTLDQLAYGIDMDLVEFRMRNLSDLVYHRQLERVAHEIGWHDHPHKSAPGSGDGWTAEGIGFGVSTWGGGGHPEAEVDVSISADGQVTAAVGVQDLGTGVRTLVAAIPAEEFGLQVIDVTALIGDTSLPKGVGSGGSVTTGSVAPAVKEAAWKARLAFIEHLAPLIETPAERIVFRDGKVFDSETPERGLTWIEACRTLPAEGLTGHGAWREELQASGAHGAQAARVRVDLMTGHVQVLKMVSVQDSGLVLNPLAWRSQVQGAMIQGLGQALLEERVLDPELGIQLNPNFGDYKLPASLEIPELVALIDEEDTREAVIGVGEPPAIPGPGAIANAVHNACGVRITSLPITPDKVLEALASRSSR